MNFNGAELFASAYTAEQIPPAAGRRAEIVFSGRSNVGKSSLINRLLGRKALARVSSAPGKTASINFYRCGEIDFVDLPGYGFARVSAQEKQKWATLVESYFAAERPRALLIQLVDVRHAPTQDDLDMLAFLRQNKQPFVLALTKSDKLKSRQLQERLAQLPAELKDFPGARMIATSAQNGQGIEELKAAILDSLGQNDSE